MKSEASAVDDVADDDDRPVVSSSFRLRLNTMTLQVSSSNVYSGQGVSISVTGIAQVYTHSTHTVNENIVKYVHQE